MLTTLPEITFPITRAQANPLLHNVVQLNTIYAGIDERTQKAIGIVLKCFELFLDTKGAVDYVGKPGKLMQDAQALVGDGTGLSTRIGDLRAAGLSIDYHNVAVKAKRNGSLELTNEVVALRKLAIIFAQLSPRQLDEIGLMLSYLRKDSALINNATFGEEGGDY